MGEPVWTRRLSRWAVWLGILALLVSVGGAFVAGLDLIPKLAGLGSIFVGALMAILGSVFGLVAVVLNGKYKAGLMTTAVAGLLLSGGHAGFFGSRAMVSQSVPPIHDISTNLVSPPDFVKLKLRSDNLVGVGSVEKWRELHRAAYDDIKPIIIIKPVAQVLGNAERLAAERGWAVAVADPVEGRLEATASVSLIKFQDDVVVRAVATADGKGTQVDMRSVSRIGIGDLGVNAKRVREFLAALAKA